MSMGGRRILLFLLMTALMLVTYMKAGAASAPEVTMDGGVLIECGTGSVLWSKEAHRKLPMASTTKVMTALVVIESCSLDALVSVGSEAYGTEGSSMYLEHDERISVRDLLYGLMLVSGNDAAIALAVHTAGSIEAFAQLMNEKASALGCAGTNFVTPNGLHDAEHYTTAYDLAIITRAAMQNDTFRQIVGTTYHRTTTGSVSRTLKNKNKLLWEYEGGIGVKTGYTTVSGKCLVFAAERDGLMLIGVILNCYDMFPSAKRILDYGFSEYEMQPVIKAGDRVATVTVENGLKNRLELFAKQDIMIPVKRGETVEFTADVRTDRATAPIEAGQTIGHVTVYAGNRPVAYTALVAGETIHCRTLEYWWNRLALYW